LGSSIIVHTSFHFIASFDPKRTFRRRTWGAEYSALMRVPSIVWQTTAPTESLC